MLADVAEQGAAVVCSTHQMDLTPSATRCVGLRDGEKSYDGPGHPREDPLARRRLTRTGQHNGPHNGPHKEVGRRRRPA